MEYQLLIKPTVALLVVIIFVYMILRLIEKHPNFKNSYKNNLKNITLKQVFYIDSNTKIVHIVSNNFKKRYLLLIQKNNVMILDSQKQEDRE